MLAHNNMCFTVFFISKTTILTSLCALHNFLDLTLEAVRQLSPPRPSLALHLSVLRNEKALWLGILSSVLFYFLQASLACGLTKKDMPTPRHFCISMSRNVSLFAAKKSTPIIRINWSALKAQQSQPIWLQILILECK